MRKTISLIPVAVLIVFSINFADAANLSKGKRVFNKCKACHSLVAGKNRVGPSLKGIFGRKAGSAPKYRYSKAMKKAGSDGLVWSEKTIAKFLVKPRTFIKRTKMSFAGLKKTTDIKTLLAFLKHATK
ncbi:MAG: cytochrome c family protein [Pseudomonadota bacterium]|nr:cytochrome c family protein [Pseudomonadota bacterium]